MSSYREQLEHHDAPPANMFARFGEEQAPAHRGERGPARHTADLSPLEKKLRERQRVADVTAREPRLLNFYRYLRTVQPHDADELVEAIAESEWLRASPQDVRLIALRAVDRRADRLNRSIGIMALDDPLPPETSVYFRCRDLLHAGGRS